MIKIPGANLTEKIKRNPRMPPWAQPQQKAQSSKYAATIQVALDVNSAGLMKP
jgi:hypothetical protein